ncbi:hypothetical protein HHI36_013169 [Cryptolaemus montrouzieri]|uniref:Uncharacterized protein n=1 Tax=Cryptolaemus montrouzieri TaxID=559131 RepID=A0ABD2NHI1_9CUCU
MIHHVTTNWRFEVSSQAAGDLNMKRWNKIILLTPMKIKKEFDAVISHTERILLHRFKRVIIKGKRGKGVPVLFRSDVPEHIEVLLAKRSVWLSNENPYLFSKPDLFTPITGYKILEKYSRSSGAKYPDSITCTKLRKHIATLSQLYSLNETKIEQLATFMSHTIGIRKNSYRLPDDVHQTAKISKLLLLMEGGNLENLLDTEEKDDENNLDDFKQDASAGPSGLTITDLKYEEKSPKGTVNSDITKRESEMNRKQEMREY